MQQDPLVRLIQKDNFVGWVYGLDYDTARVMTNDLWKAPVQGVPLNCFLSATTFDSAAYSAVPEADREVVLMRVVGSAVLPQDDDMVRTKIDHFQQQDNIFVAPTRDFDDITRNLMQFSGLECRLLGTFYMLGGAEIGIDLEGPWPDRAGQSGLGLIALSFINHSLAGAGYLPRAAGEFHRVAQRAIQHLDHANCEMACYRCLKSYTNQAITRC